MKDKYIVVKEGTYHHYTYKVGDILTGQPIVSGEVYIMRNRDGILLMVWDNEVKLLKPKNRIGGVLLIEDDLTKINNQGEK